MRGSQLAALITTMVVVGLASIIVTNPTVRAIPLPACAVEDGSTGPVPCAWDAREHGNGQGLSFIIHTDGSITYA